MIVVPGYDVTFGNGERFNRQKEAFRRQRQMEKQAARKEELIEDTSASDRG